MASFAILAFNPWDGGSHRAVRESISRHSRHRWDWITLAPRGWKWRMRLGALQCAQALEDRGTSGAGADAIFATSLIGLAELRAVLAQRFDRSLASVPAVLYMHENQAVYPEGFVPEGPAAHDVQFAMTNALSVEAADLVLWNSRWNQTSFRKGLGRILQHAPDLDAALARRLRNTSAREVVAWPPVEVVPRSRVLQNPEAAATGSIRVLWPHRWEHDKGPGELLSLADEWTQKLGIRWTILGERFRKVPEAMKVMLERHAHAIDHAGFVPDRSAYLEHLGRCDWVLSTARHEFFGIAVVEALLCGCLPWLPDRLSYPELLPAIARGLSPEHPPREPAAVRAAIAEHLRGAVAPRAVERIDDLIEQVIRDRASLG